MFTTIEGKVCWSYPYMIVLIDSLPSFLHHERLLVCCDQLHEIVYD